MCLKTSLFSFILMSSIVFENKTLHYTNIKTLKAPQRNMSVVFFSPEKIHIKQLLYFYY